jgi:3-hydroxyacyl-[acyl-carrier-protein] dehydratase
MVLQEFYNILDQTGPHREVSIHDAQVEKYRFVLELNPAHPVYEGHFAGNPVVPGVCQVQMISEVLALTQGFPVRLVHADNVKFMTLMVPEKNRVVDLLLSIKKTGNETISVNASMQNGEVVFIKFKGIYRQEI